MILKLDAITSEVSDINGVIRIQIDIPFDVKFVCAYIFEVDDKRVIIDAGLNVIHWKRHFLKALEDRNLTIKDLDYCIVTHEHLDHCGLIKYFKRKNPNIQILMHETTNESLSSASNPSNFEKMEDNASIIVKEIVSYGMSKKQIESMLKIFLVWPKIVRYQKPDGFLKDDDELDFQSSKLKIIWTPGHSLGHICVFDTKNRYLFSGDHILSRITPHIGVYHITSLVTDTLLYPNILDLYLKSLDKIDQLNPSVIFPAHQEIIYNPHERILEIKKHHQNRFHEITRAIEKKPLTPFEISQIHFGKELDDMNSYLALNEVLSHLIHLEGEGKVNRIEKNGKILFST